ncbi:hypothetical protein [Rubritalea sp.]|uniref:hypothetical protein n=1 Tax=Rubritalea sp. TaxID=2109375 RepID=UPI003F4ABAE2
MVSLQGIYACDGHGEHHQHDEHVHIEKSIDGLNEVITLDDTHHEHEGDCDCICHDHAPVEPASMPAPRMDYEAPEFMEIFTWNSLPDFAPHINKAPPIAQNLSLPPPSSAVEFCSQHCRFLL